MKDRHDIIIIGAGHNGLTCAAYLAQAGLEVLVLERRDVLGGAAASEEILSGHVVDSCAHRLAGLDGSVSRDLSLKRHGLDVIQADPSLFAPTHDGDYLTLHPRASQSVESLRRHSKRDADRYPVFLELFDAATRFIQTLYDHPAIRLPRPSWRDAGLMFELARRFRRLSKSGKADVIRMLPMSVADLTGEWFETEVVRGAIAAAGIAGLSQGPMAAGTVYALLHAHATAQPGAIRPTYFVRGGIGRLSLSLAEAAKTAGATIETRVPVRSIVVRDHKAIGVLLADGTERRARCVISNADPTTTALTFLDPVLLGPTVVRNIRHVRYRGACAKVHLIVDALPKFTGLAANDTNQLHGVISIAPSVEYLERAFDAAKYGDISPRPYLEMTIPTLRDAPRASGAGHVLSIVVQYAPHKLSTGDWNSDAKDHLLRNTIDTLSEYAPNVPDIIRDCHVVTPRDLEETYGLPEGNINHGDLTLDQVQFMRPIPEWSRYATTIGNVYLCGAGAHGGGGVNCIPGRNAARVVLRDFKRNLHT